jgi:hypothetical protein
MTASYGTLLVLSKKSVFEPGMHLLMMEFLVIVEIYYLEDRKFLAINLY